MVKSQFSYVGNLLKRKFFTILLVIQNFYFISQTEKKVFKMLKVNFHWKEFCKSAKFLLLK